MRRTGEGNIKTYGSWIGYLTVEKIEIVADSSFLARNFLLECMEDFMQYIYLVYTFMNSLYLLHLFGLPQ